MHVIHRKIRMLNQFEQPAVRGVLGPELCFFHCDDRGHDLFCGSAP
jgi:hypothetical protein